MNKLRSGTRHLPVSLTKSIKGGNNKNNTSNPFIMDLTVKRMSEIDDVKIVHNDNPKKV
ncbi:MAG TPA: hypothetical protein PLR20_11970 [Syntrophales bacterium]|nr:hypothetical protein [Syntrophales bacterium]HPI57141.1 hypothetical protein [Syntrophales bacterium]HPN24772.1 hypothetical protein [Syntrophales bacterium]HQM30057.1 hypothetical protein [Syntrophales bacterium]